MKSCIFLMILATMAFTVTEAVNSPALLMQHIYKGPPLPEKRSDLDLPDKWIEQRIDNFDALNSATYRMVIVIFFRTV